MVKLAREMDELASDVVVCGKAPTTSPCGKLWRATSLLLCSLRYVGELCLCLVSARLSASPVSTCCVALCVVSGHGRGVSSVAHSLPQFFLHVVQSALGGPLVNSFRFYGLLHRHRSKRVIIQKGEPHERNPCAPSFEEQHLGKPHNKQFVTAK